MKEKYITDDEREKCKKVADAFAELYEIENILVVDAGRYGFVKLQYYRPPQGFEDAITFTDSRSMFENLWEEWLDEQPEVEQDTQCEHPLEAAEQGAGDAVEHSEAEGTDDGLEEVGDDSHAQVADYEQDDVGHHLVDISGVSSGIGPFGCYHRCDIIASDMAEENPEN